jgi:hypothetical protein
MAWMISASVPSFALTIDAAKTIKNTIIFTTFNVKYAIFSNLARDIFVFISLVHKTVGIQKQKDLSNRILIRNLAEKRKEE